MTREGRELKRLNNGTYVSLVSIKTKTKETWF